MKHKHAIKLHFMKRMYERLGVNITDEEYNILCDNCFYGRYKLLCRQTHDCIYRINYKNFSFNGVYNEAFKRLITIKPHGIKYG